MPKGNLRSRTKRRKLVRTPGGRLTTHYDKRKHKAAVCSKCGRPLLGVPRRDSLSKNVAKSKRSPNRPFGGILCSKCTRLAIKSGDGNA